jgi:hypothetical protein
MEELDPYQNQAWFRSIHLADTFGHARRCSDSVRREKTEYTEPDSCLLFSAAVIPMLICPVLRAAAAGLPGCRVAVADIQRDLLGSCYCRYTEGMASSWWVSGRREEIDSAI